MMIPEIYRGGVVYVVSGEWVLECGGNGLWREGCLGLKDATRGTGEDVKGNAKRLSFGVTGKPSSRPFHEQQERDLNGKRSPNVMPL